MIPGDAADIDGAHLNTDDLHLLALAELDASARVRTHLAACAECAGEYLALRQIVQLGRAAGVDQLLTPPAGVWAGIHAELGLSEAVRTLSPVARHADLTDAAAGPAASVVDGSAATPSAAEPSVEPAVPSAAEPAAPPSKEPAAQPATPSAAPTATPSAAPTAPPPAAVRPLPRRWVPFAAAAGVIGLVGGIAIGVASTTGSSPSEQVVAEAALDALPGWTASGTARVEQSADGRRSVVVNLEAPASSTSLREVWLLKADASGLVSIGFLDGSSGRFTIPASVDLAQYPLVDVSAEPADGDPAHSGDSIVRGQLHAL